MKVEFICRFVPQMQLPGLDQAEAKSQATPFESPVQVAWTQVLGLSLAALNKTQ